MTRNKTKLAATLATTLFALAVLPGAVLDLVQPPFVLEMGETLGVPAGLFALVGIWKLVGVAVLAAPGLDRLGSWVERVREWAYAGFFFDLTGAAYLHAIAGDHANVGVPVVFAILLVVSYLLRRSAREANADAPGQVLATPS